MLPRLEQLKKDLLALKKENKSCTGIFTRLRSDDELKDLINRHTQFLDDLTVVTLSQRSYHIREDLNELLICPVCDKPRQFFRISKGYHATCGKKECKNNSKVSSFKKTIKEKYPDGYFTKGSTARNRYEKTMLKNWGVDHNFKSKEIRDDIKKTMKSKYNHEHPLQCKEISNKRNETCLENHGTLNMFSLDSTKDTIKAKYGVNNAMKNKEISYKVTLSSSETKRNQLREKLSSYNIKLIDYLPDRCYFLCNKCNKKFDNHPVTINSKLRKDIEPCTFCNPVISWVSKMEEELIDFIREVYNGDILLNHRDLFKGFSKFNEVDIYIPELNIAFEFNGIYWHSEIHKSPDYHQDKSKFLLNKGIKLYHIWEDDWVYKNDLIKSVIRSILGKNERIFARKCDIKIITQIEYKNFCLSNHLKGYAPATYPIGLFYNKILVSILSFSKTRKLIESNKSKYDFEIIRNCSSQGISIVGGLSKMLTYFKNNISKGSIVTYSDLSLSPDPMKNAYNKIGFNLVKTTDPGYYWVDSGIRINRLNFTKAKLIKAGYDENMTGDEIMYDRGFYKIWDCGNYKYELLP